MPENIIIIISIISGIIIGYFQYQKMYIPFSQLVDTKTIHGINPNWAIQTSSYCVGDCRNYSSSYSSSRGSSSFGGGK